MADWNREIADRLAHLSVRPEREAEIVEELSQHLEDQVRERIAGGMDPEEARREALTSLDTPEILSARLREAEATAGAPVVVPGAPPIGIWLSQLWQDIRLAVRTLQRRPWFSISALATLALTIGPTTAIVSVGNWLLWTPSPAVKEPDRLVVVWTGQWRGPGSVSPRGLSYLNLADLRSATRTLANLAGWQESTLSLSAPGQKPRVTQGGFVSASFFEVLGIRLAAGRAFLPEEDRPPFGLPVAVLSHAYARQAFGSPELALQKTVSLNGRPMTVVGVAPAGFSGAAPTSIVDVWYPGAAYPYVNHFPEQSAQRFTGRANGLFYTFIGRLAAGIDAGAAQTELDALIPRLAARYPDDNEGLQRVQARIYPGLGPQELQRPQLSRLVNGLLVVAGVLLLLGCANLSNLLVSEGVRTRREHAVRLALGASRGRLIRQLLTQSMVLSVVGAGLGVGLAVWLKQSVQLWMLPEINLQPTAPSIPLDGLVLSVTLVTAMGCGLLAGVTPAWLGTRAALRRGLARAAGHQVAAHGQRVRTVLAAAQFALSLTLVAGSVLMVSTLRHLSRVDLGFETSGVAIQHLSLRSHGYAPDRARAYATELVARVRADSSVAAASLASGFPFGYTHIQRVQPTGAAPGDTIDVRSVATDERFPDVFGLQLLHGRYLRADEVLKTLQSGSPVVVSESLARVLYGRADVVGERLTFPRTLSTPSRDFTIVGVMRDTRTNSLTDNGDPLVYIPLSDEDFVGLQIALATRSSLPLTLASTLIERHALQLDSTLPPGPARSLRQWVDRTFARSRVFANVLLLLTLIGVPLAAVGLYGLLAQTVGERQRELGIRVAIGAPAAHIAAVVARQAAWISAIGIAAGLVLSYWGAHLVKAYLVGVSESDPRVYAATIALLLLVTAMATARPAWTATRVNPVDTLRTE